MPVEWGQVCVEWTFSPSLVVVTAVGIAMTFVVVFTAVFAAAVLTAILVLLVLFVILTVFHFFITPYLN